jgi:hypothetical protein
MEKAPNVIIIGGSFEGVYSAGDMARITHSVPFATSDGVTAGVNAHQSFCR